MPTATRVRFQLKTPIELVDFSQSGANNIKRCLEPGAYELEEVPNPYGGVCGAVEWLVLIKDGKATTIGTSQPIWEEHGELLSG